MTTSDTPRTDAASHIAETAGGCHAYEVTHADFARQLERELTTAQRELAGYKEGHATLERTCQLLGQDMATLRERMAIVERDRVHCAQMLDALEMIAGIRQCADPLMSDKDIARAVLAAVKKEQAKEGKAR